MTTIEERVSRLEKVYESAATKEDIVRIERKLESMESHLYSKLVGSMVLIAGLTVAVLRFIG